MAYNLESLSTILEQILQYPNHHHRWTLDPNKKPDIESLLEKARLLKEILGNSSPTATGDEIESLESRIRDAAHEAEDVLESHLADRILSVRAGESFIISPPGLQKVIGELDSVGKEIKRMMDGSSSSPAADLTMPRSDPNPKNILVGFTKDLIEMKDRLTGQQAKLEIIPIVGMGGIGKTTLAQNVYNDPLVISYFDIRAWITISQDYNLREILLGLLTCVIGKLTDEMLETKNDKLALLLYRSLCGRRYLIVLDDMWNTKAWDDTKMLFPDDNNGSRIVVTTRELDVANYAGSERSHHQVNFLDKIESWNLLRQKVFSQENCPPYLEKVGKRIANSCGGLPLAIHVIGGLLSQANRTQESWEQVAFDVSSAAASKDEQFSKILSLSYNYLPHHLRPCFLYMGAFPEDYEVRASKLIRLWAAEGFLKPIADNSLEEAGEVYLKALVDRNLLLVRQQETKRYVNSYSIHDLLRDLCVQKASEEKFLHIKNWKVANLLEDTLCLRRVSVHSSYNIRDFYGSAELMLLARSFLCVGPASRAILSPVFLTLRLLRILDILRIEFHKFPEEILRLVNLRYLAFACHSDLSSSISILCNLETLIFRWISPYWTQAATYEIFEMPRLRHIKVKETYPNYEFLYDKTFVLQENLSIETLSTIKIKTEMDEIFKSLPNLKKLGLFSSYDISVDIDLTCLRELKRLKCSSIASPESDSYLPSLIFPPSIKKLTINGCKIPMGVMNKIGSLPNLEVLKLQKSYFDSPAYWEPAEGEFCQLQFLVLEQLNLVKWVADETHFPRLERLVIRYCSALEEIPCGIGDISTLEIIEIHESSPSVAASARKIQEQQLDLGNYGLQVRITGSSH